MLVSKSQFEINNHEEEAEDDDDDDDGSLTECESSFIYYVFQHQRTSQNCFVTLVTFWMLLWFLSKP